MKPIMKPIDVKSNSYAKYNVDSNEEDPKFQFGDHVRILKYKKFFAMILIDVKSNS